MRLLRVLLLTTLVIAPQAARADHYASFYVIPVASRTPGANGTQWMSDVAIQNFQTTPLEVQLVLIESGESSSENARPIVTDRINGTATVPAGGSVLLTDILNGYRGSQSVTGSILVGADRPFAVTGRSYSSTPSGDTVGQTVQPARDFLDNTIGRTDLSMAVAYLPGLISNARFRTNLGFVAGNATGGTMALEITLRDASGTMVGTSRRFAIAGNSFTHVQFSSRVIGDRPFDIGSATIRIVEGSGAVVPYASVIDNVTADAVFVLGQFPANSTSAKAAGASSSVFRSVFNRVKVME